jgi:autophagy-related protein 5
LAFTLTISQIQFPRLSYLGLLIPRLKPFFSQSLIYPDVEPKDAWLSYQGVPLKWHYPLGLLYDLYSGCEPYSADGQGEEQLSEESRAWKLTVHFSEYPVEQLVKLDAGGKHLYDLYMNSVKEVRQPSLLEFSKSKIAGGLPS